jgi:hypothetical protein
MVLATNRMVAKLHSVPNFWELTAEKTDNKLGSYSRIHAIC